MRESDMSLRSQARSNMIRHIAVPLTEADIFATAEFQERVTLWSLQRKEKCAQIETVLDFGGARLAVVQRSRFCALLAANFYGPTNAYDLDGQIVWSRKDLVGVQQLIPIAGGSEPMVGVGADDEPYRVLSALDGKEITRLNEIKELYPSCMTGLVLATTRHGSVCLQEINARPIWEQPLKSFGILHAALSSEEVVYSEAGGAIYCFDLHGRQKWVVDSGKARHFLRVSWNKALQTWMAIDWDYENGGPKRLIKISQSGVLELVASLGEPAETEFFAKGDYVITASGKILETRSGGVIWNFLST